MNRLADQTLALAGMFQAAVLVDQLALTGTCDRRAFDGSYHSLFTFDAASTLDVFGQIRCLQNGFTALNDYLGGATRGSSRNIAYYVLSMLKLGLIVMSDSKLSAKLFDELRDIESRSGEFELSRSSIVAQLDGLYQDRISELNPRILVRGEQSHLLNDANAARIRTLLLAGIRSAVLWRQLGGSKWKLFLARKKYVAIAKGFLERC